MELASRLRERQSEIEQVIRTRVFSVADPAEVEDPEYMAGLKAAVETALDYGLSALEKGELQPEPIPMPLIEQAQSAARTGVSLDVVLRRYFAGYSLLGAFIAEEAEKSGPLGPEQALRLSRAQTSLFDRVVVAITEAYVREAEGRRRSAESLKAERVRKLLAGELVDDPELGYQLGTRWHLGIVATGPGALQAPRELATRLDRRLLFVRPCEGTVWAWFGGSEPVSVEEAVAGVISILPAETTLTLGECAHGIAGWRLTHRQALAALSIADRAGERVVRYRDVALLAAALRDDILAESLKEIFLVPLLAEGDDGAASRQTLRAYFEAGRNVSSAAARLGISRNTVSSRLRAIEERVGRSLDVCAAEMETALRLQRLSERRIG